MGEIRDVNKRTCSRDVAQVMRYRGVVDNSVSNHLVGAQLEDRNQSRSTMSVLDCEDERSDDNIMLAWTNLMLRGPDSKLAIADAKGPGEARTCEQGYRDLGIRQSSDMVIFLSHFTKRRP